MISAISTASKCSQKPNTLTKKWTRLTPQIKGSLLSTIRVAVQAGSNLETNRGGKTNLSIARRTTTGKWTITKDTNDYKISKSTITNTGNTTISNTVKNLAKIDGTIIRACTPKTSASTRQTTRVTITIKTITCIRIDATNTATPRNRCRRICHPESSIQTKMSTSRKAHKSSFQFSRYSRTSLWGSSKTANTTTSRHFKTPRRSILSNTCQTSTQCISKIINSNTNSL
jgi:hypothetical protein